MSVHLATDDSTVQHVSMVSAVADWAAYDGCHGTREVNSAEEALTLCREIEAREPRSRTIVGFTTGAGHFFAVGLGDNDSCAMYSESADPPYFQSKGDRPAEQSIDFAYGGEYTELPGTVLIGRESAFAALAEFMQSGSRPAILEWDET